MSGELRQENSDDLDEFTYELMRAICGDASMEFEMKPASMEDRMNVAWEKSRSVAPLGPPEIKDIER